MISGKKLSFLLYLLIIFQTFFGLSVPPVFAVSDPLAVPNNKIGVHILDTSEISDAAKLVNSHGGDWGYVTIPIRSDDRDREKWINFFKQSGELHLIPIIRLITYVDGDTWVEPTPYDLVDFANFLSDMPWPTTNRYIVLFNEPNHSNEWGGNISPEAYARLLVDANGIFKSRSSDFFLISAGLDMSAPNSATSLDALEYYRKMSQSVPDWYSSMDGLAVHAYPNPGFVASPFSDSRYGISSYEYELKYLKRLGYSGKPLFITETGTKNSGNFYIPAFSRVWTDSNIVAITPFLLFAGTGSFYEFSLLNIDHQPTQNYLDIQSYPKVTGSPLLSNNSPTAAVSGYAAAYDTPAPTSSPTIWTKLSRILSLRDPYLYLGNSLIPVEIADTPVERTQGLSDRKSLPEESGMLFIFSQKQPLSFWMKDMNFPLDFVWIADGRVVEMNSDVPEPSKTGGVPIVIQPANFADQVLEVNAGFISRHHIQVGDQVTLVWR